MLPRGITHLQATASAASSSPPVAVVPPRVMRRRPLPIEVHLYPDDLLVPAKIGVPTEVDAHDVAATIYAAGALIGKRG